MLERDGVSSTGITPVNCEAELLVTLFGNPKSVLAETLRRNKTVGTREQEPDRA